MRVSQFSESAHKIPLTTSLAASMLVLSALEGCTTSATSTSATETPASTSSCEPFTIYAQNRFQPPGAAGRVEPDITSGQAASFMPNQELTAIGYKETDHAVYPNNNPAIQGYLWFLVKSDVGLVYVNDAAVRAAPTEQDPSGGFSQDVGPIVEPDPNCKL